jgi:hypothetical protein
MKDQLEGITVNKKKVILKIVNHPATIFNYNCRKHMWKSSVNMFGVVGEI